MPNTVSANWDESSPVITEPRRDGALEVNTLREGVADRIAKEHVHPAAADVGGEHLEGSARAYFQDGAPVNRPDGGGALAAADEGRLWVDSNDSNKLYVWDGVAGAWEEASPQRAVFSQAIIAHDGTLVDVLAAMKTAGGHTNAASFAELVVYHFAILTADGTGFTLGDIEYKKSGGVFVAIQPGQFLNGHVSSVGGMFILNPGDAIRYVNYVGTHLTEQASTFEFTV